MKLNTVELFSGIGGFRLALDKQGHTTIWANDICPIACKVYANIFGSEELVHGDIHQLIDHVPNHGLLVGGFPCQPFSHAGKRKGFQDTRGTAFHSIVRILEKHKPKYFILENVPPLLTIDTGKCFSTILFLLSNLGYKIEWRILNAKQYGLAQNRKRLIIVGVRSKIFHRNYIMIQQEDIARMSTFDRYGLFEFDSWYKLESHRKFPNWGVAWNSKYYAFDLQEFSNNPQLTIKSILQDPIDVNNNMYYTESTKKRLKSSTLVNRLIDGVEVIANQQSGKRQGYTVFGVHGISPTLTASGSRHAERYQVGEHFRRLTHIEYARLQGFPDNHCSVVSTSQQYRLYGNAMPPPMVDWVLPRLELL